MTEELQDRIVFGIIAAFVAAMAIYQGGVVFYALVMFASLFASLEFDRLRGDGKTSFFYCAVPLLLAYHPLIACALVALAVVMIMAAQYPAKKYYPWLMICLPYITIPAVALLWLRAEPHGLAVVVWLVLVVVATDVGAYFTGRSFGKNLLAPEISPKKTWEGLAGGAGCAAVASWVVTGHFIFVLVGLVFSVVEQVSDLLESAIKRHFEVKDTGNILPGHGGIMDRTDGFVLTAPLAALSYSIGVLTW